MPTIWRREDGKWRPMSPSGFPLEEKLHDLVEEGPSLLPLLGSPRLAVIGREVSLGSGSADLLAVEEDGRPVVIEVKLKANQEAKRAVVAQVLAYAAALYGMPLVELERRCAPYLTRRGFADITAAVKDEDQTGGFDPEAFREHLGEYLESGEFRVVIVLDDAPADLVVLARYLADVSDRLRVDVLTVHNFEVGVGDGFETLIVPERVDLDRPPALAVPRPGAEGQLIAGADAFVAAVADAPEPERSRLARLVEWARSLEVEGLVALETYRGKSQLTLLPRLQDERVGLATIWRPGTTNLGLWRSVIERRAPGWLPIIERVVAPRTVGQATNAEPTDELLEALRGAYRSAVGGPPAPSPPDTA